MGDHGHKLRYDFAIMGANEQVTRLIEFDGAQHYKASSYFGGEDAFEKQKRYDKIKNDYAISRNISLVRIPCTKQSSLT